MTIKIKVDGVKYFLCESCGVYKKDKFSGKIKKQKFCTACFSNFSAHKSLIKS